MLKYLIIFFMEASKLRSWSKIMVDWYPWSVVTYTLRPQPRLAAKMIVKLKNLITWQSLEKTFTAWDNLEEADIATWKAQYLYKAWDSYVFMDNETFDQFEFTEDQLWDQANFLMDWMNVGVLKWNSNVVNIELPPTVTLKVVSTEPWVKWNTADWWSKNATLETWISIQVPLFIQEWDGIVVSTETWLYRERAK